MGQLVILSSSLFSTVIKKGYITLFGRAGAEARDVVLLPEFVPKGYAFANLYRQKY